MFAGKTHSVGGAILGLAVSAVPSAVPATIPMDKVDTFLRKKKVPCSHKEGSLFSH